MDDLVTFITSSVEIHTPTVGVVFAAILVCLLLYVSGFASGSEIAFFSLSPNDIEELDPQKSKADKNIQMLVAKIFLSLYFVRCVQDLSVLRRKREICYEELRE